MRCQTSERMTESASYTYCAHITFDRKKDTRDQESRKDLQQRAMSYTHASIFIDASIHPSIQPASHAFFHPSIRSVEVFHVLRL